MNDSQIEIAPVSLRDFFDNDPLWNPSRNHVLETEAVCGKIDLRAQAEKTGAAAFTARNNAGSVGFIVVAPAQSFVHPARILALFVKAPERKQGVGTALVNYASDRFGELTVEMPKSAMAVAYFEKLGFDRIGQAEPPDDSFLRLRRLRAVVKQDVKGESPASFDIVPILANAVQLFFLFIILVDSRFRPDEEMAAFFLVALFSLGYFAALRRRALPPAGWRLWLVQAVIIAANVYQIAFFVVFVDLVTGIGEMMSGILGRPYSLLDDLDGPEALFLLGGFAIPVLNIIGILICKRKWPKL